ncbi:MAG: outer-membrane lipoprotein carrier protein LolA, partial [Myxococcota bacterium]|nr:outer-membrane lipoprotein carrier protein LolA [Myxococcota bacterium]
PTVQSYYSDGQSITVWNEMNNQVLISNQMGQANELVDILTDLSKLSEKYALTLQKEDEKAYSISVTPKVKQQFDSMEIAINKKSWVLEQIFVKGEMTGEITLQFSNVQLNTITEASVFSFTPPEGAEVIQTEGF